MTPTDIDSIENLSRKYKATATRTIPIVAHICHVALTSLIIQKISLRLVYRYHVSY